MMFTIEEISTEYICLYVCFPFKRIILLYIIFLRCSKICIVVLARLFCYLIICLWVILSSERFYRALVGGTLRCITNMNVIN